MGFLSSIFGGGHADGPDIGALTAFYSSQYNSRLKDINDFSRKLDYYNTQYSNSLANLYNTAYARHAGNLAAAYGAKGMDVNGGAFAAELARASAEMSANMAPSIYQNAANNANSVEAYKQNAYNGMVGGVGSAMEKATFAQYDRQNMLNDRFSDNMGKFVGAAAGNFASGFAGGNPFSMAGQGARSGVNNLMSGGGGGYSPSFDMQGPAAGGNPFYGAPIPGIG